MGSYFEEFEPGTQYETVRRTITEQDVMAFAQLTGDINPLHIDHDFAAGQRFGRPIAHGALGLSYLLGLISGIGVFDGTAVALLGVENWKFRHPIFYGDTVHGLVTIENCRLTRDKQYGIIYRHAVLINQDGLAVQEGDMNIMMKRRPSEARE